MTSIVLTPEQRANILLDADRKIEMLSEEELEAIATQLNEVINIPVIGEAKEQVVLVKLVKMIDRYIYQRMPNEIYELVRKTSDGISDEEAQLIEQRLATGLNNNINIPYLTEGMEQRAFEFVIKIITNALRKERSL